MKRLNKDGRVVNRGWLRVGTMVMVKGEEGYWRVLNCENDNAVIVEDYYGVRSGDWRNVPVGQEPPTFKRKLTVHADELSLAMIK